MEKIEVWQFKKWNINQDKYDASRAKATEDFIERNGCVKIDGTDQQILPSQLNDNGLFPIEPSQSE